MVEMRADTRFTSETHRDLVPVTVSIAQDDGSVDFTKPFYKSGRNDDRLTQELPVFTGEVL